MISFLQDARYGLRLIFKRPAMTVVAILALAVGLGLTISMFSVLHGALYRGLPFPDSDRLILVQREQPGSGLKIESTPAGDFYRWRESIATCQSLMGCYSGTINLTGEVSPERFNGAFVTSDFLTTLGLRPLLGRDFTRADETAPGAIPIFISHRIWLKHYRGDPKAVGKSVRVNGEQGTIAAVLPPDFHFPSNEDIWMICRQPDPQAATETMPMVVLGRLQEGVSMAAAQADFARLTISGPPDQATVSRSTNDSASLRVTLIKANDYVPSDSKRWLWLTMGAAFFVLAIACANVANLLLVRSAARQREMAIRSALGASRRRLFWQILTESLILTSMGTLGGLIMATWLVDLLTVATDGLDKPHHITFAMDATVFGFAATISILTAFVCGLLPALRAGCCSLAEGLKDGSRWQTEARFTRFSQTLTIAQIAFAALLLTAAGLALRTVSNLRAQPLTYDPDRLITFRLALFPNDYPAGQDRTHFFDRLANKTRELPGVAQAGWTSWISLYGGSPLSFQPCGLQAAEQAAEGMMPDFRKCRGEAVSSEYFGMFGAQLLAGRLFNADDGPGCKMVAIVSQSLAQSAWPGQSAVGQTMTVFKPLDDPAAPPVELAVVGVVSDVNTTGYPLREPEIGTVYTPIWQEPSRFATLVVLAKGPQAEVLAEPVSRLVLTLDPNLPVYFVKTMGDFLADKRLTFDLMADVFTVLGVLAVLLAAIGVYGVMSFSVSQRRREIGIRMVLGARRRGLAVMVLRQGLLQLILGLLLGLSIAWFGGQFLAVFLYGVKPGDPVTLSAVALLLAIMALAASLVPMRRAVRIMPFETLHCE